jgi:GDP/UDP-N,N'-diacetylbacillosamine 2-epimerase (hydrolysing)
MMKVLVLTSSRADFGIYLPLLKKMEKDAFFQVEIVAFGTHLSKQHGYTLSEIKAQGFHAIHEINTVPTDDSPLEIAKSMGDTTQKFAEFWRKNAHEVDWVLCLGDRYEMFAAIVAGIPFRIPFAHLHGGETTLGAMDNVFRHSISLAARLHFVATPSSKTRLLELLGDQEGIHYVGALGLDNLKDFGIYSTEEFREKFQMDLTKKTILCTVHPETAGDMNNQAHVLELISAIKSLEEYQFLITLPNADTESWQIRKALIADLQHIERVKLVENLGSKGYFSAMQHCAMLLGNTSSGIIEAASFGRYVIDLGDRQKGREAGENVFHVPFDSEKIISQVRKIELLPLWPQGNLYQKGNAANQIMEVLKKM